MFSTANPQGRMLSRTVFKMHFGSVGSLWLGFCPGSSAVSVLERMLLLDPESRATAAEALALPYFTEFREPEEETEAQLYDHSLDNADLPLSQWKRKDEACGKLSPDSSQTRKDETPRLLMCCISLFFRSHLHRDLNLQTCCVRVQRNAALKRAGVRSKMQFWKGDRGEKTCQTEKLNS